MTILHQLDELRTGLPGTEVVAYVDLGAGMVLGWSSAMVQPQEWLDELCVSANEILGGAGADTGEAIKLSATGAMVLLRAPDAPAEALCIVGAPDIDLDAARYKARTVLENVTE